MSTLREWTNRLRYLGRPGRFERELDEEIRGHIEARAAELEQAGAPHPEALRQARLEFGSVPQVREASREAWQFQWAEHFASV